VDFRGDERSAASLLARFSVPLYDGGDISARTSQAKHLADQRAYEAVAVREQVRAAAAAAWVQFEAAKARVVNQNLQLRAARTAVDGIREQWALGDRTMREVLDAEQEFLTAEVNLVVAERDRVVASYAVAKMVGRLLLASLNGVQLAATNDTIFSVRSAAAAPQAIPKRAHAPRSRLGCAKKCDRSLQAWTLRHRSPDAWMLRHRLSDASTLRPQSSQAWMLRR
jgi:Outer membrane efflux protein